MEELYRMVGLSRQSVHAARRRQQAFDEELSVLVGEVDAIRSEHPGCGLEKIYKMLKPVTMGRDKFCEIFISLGYRVRALRNYRRTTIPGHISYPNLIEGMMVSGPWHVLQSDITYFDLGDIMCYLIFITDIYTREIVGHHAGDHMRASSNVKAMEMALSRMPDQLPYGCIHHSDRGSQYGSRLYTDLLSGNGMAISMGSSAQENAYAERVNGTIKNEYLRHWRITTLPQLRRAVARAVDHYNNERPHMAFGNEYSPSGFRRSLVDLDTRKRPMVIVYTEGQDKPEVASSHLGLDPERGPLAHNCPIAKTELELNN